MCDHNRNNCFDCFSSENCNYSVSGHDVIETKVKHKKVACVSRDDQFEV
jgi:hypothetical protein